MDPTVRRCRRCAEAAMIAVREWDRSHSVYGLPTGTTKGGGGLDYVCQRCGAGFTEPSPSVLSWLMFPLGAMFVALGLALTLTGLATLSPWLGVVGLVSLGFGGVVVRSPLLPLWQRWRYPVVPEAPCPPLRFSGIEPSRTCTCGKTAACVQTTANRLNGIYTGTEYTFRCEACDTTFTIGSPFEVFTTTAAGAFLVWVATILVPDAEATWKSWVAFGFAALLGLALLGSTALSARARLRHPLTARERNESPPDHDR